MIKYTRTITRRDGTRLAEFSGPHGNLCIKLAPGMTLADARREAERRMRAIERRVTKLLGF